MSLAGLTKVHRVTRQRLVASMEAGLGASEHWIDEGTLDCRIQPRSQRELGRGGGDAVAYTHRIYFSSDPELDDRCRLKFAGRIFEDLRVRDVNELNRLWVVEAREIPQRIS